MHLPVSIPEYTDFFCSLEHCSNVGVRVCELCKSADIYPVRVFDKG